MLIADSGAAEDGAGVDAQGGRAPPTRQVSTRADADSRCGVRARRDGCVQEPKSRPGRAREMPHTMMAIRAFEERAQELYLAGPKCTRTMHLSIRPEPTAGNELPLADYLVQYPSRHDYAGLGADVDRMMARVLASEAAIAPRAGWSMHIADVDANNLGPAIVGGGLLPVSRRPQHQLRRTARFV